MEFNDVWPRRQMRDLLTAAACISSGLSVFMLAASRADAADIRPVIGAYARTKVKRGDTLAHIARREDVNAEILARLNNIHSGRVHPGRSLTLPTLHILPRQPNNGIVLNIPERQVYVFRGGQARAVYPVAVGMRNWQTAMGEFKLISKVTNPRWQPTKEMVAREDIKDDPVPPGKDNPVADRWMGWSKKGYGFHSTNVPASVGKVVSHGCVRLYPESAHKMFDLVNEGESIFSIYEPITVGRRENRYYMSVFPDIYHRGMVSAARAKAILQSLGLLSRVNMHEVAVIVRKQISYPTQFHLKPESRQKATLKQQTHGQPGSGQAKKQTGPAPHQKPNNSAGHSSPPEKSGKAADTRKSIPAVADEAKAQGLLLLNLIRSARVRLINPERDRLQIEQISMLGEVRSGSSPVSIAPGLGRALAHLANCTTPSKPLVLMSLVRMHDSERPAEPHSRGLAVDIAGFGGHTITNAKPSEATAGVLAIVSSLPAGRYRLGLPKAPGSPPIAFAPPPARPSTWPFFPAPVPAIGQIGAVTLVLPKIGAEGPILNEKHGYVPDIVQWENERGAPIEAIGDARVRAALRESKRRGVEIAACFPDAADHLHLDVAPD